MTMAFKVPLAVDGKGERAIDLVDGVLLGFIDTEFFAVDHGYDDEPGAFENSSDIEEPECCEGQSAQGHADAAADRAGEQLTQTGQENSEPDHKDDTV